MPVDGSDHRWGVVKDRENRFRRRGYEALGILGPAVNERAQVDTGRETPTSASDHDGPFDVSHRGDDDLEQVQVERVDRRMVESDYRHTLDYVCVGHVSSTLSGALGPNNRALSS